MILRWFRVTDGLPDVGVDVIGLNINTGQMEFGFFSAVDKKRIGKDQRVSLWCDFSFDLTHWAYANLPTGNPIVDLFYAEIDSYPRGSVAHSIAKVETEWDPYNEGLLLKAVSRGQNNKALYMAGVVDGESFKTDLAYRREFVGSVLERLRGEWARKRTKWVKAQSRYVGY